MIEYTVGAGWSANITRADGELWCVRTGIPDEVTAQEIRDVAVKAYRRALEDAREVILRSVTSIDLMGNS